MLHDRSPAAQNACALALLAGFLLLTLVAPRYVEALPLMAAIAAYCLAGSFVWWRLASPSGAHRPDERVRRRWWEASTVALYAFFIGVLALSAWRASRGAVDAPLFYWLDACVVLWVVDGMRRTGR